MTIHHYTETATPDAAKRYPSDLNDQEFDADLQQMQRQHGDFLILAPIAG